jgi:hypothetical protein
MGATHERKQADFDHLAVRQEVIRNRAIVGWCDGATR